MGNLLSVKEAATRLGMSPWTLRQWISRKKIDYIRVGERAVRIPEGVIEKIVADGLRKG